MFRRILRQWVQWWVTKTTVCRIREENKLDYLSSTAQNWWAILVIFKAVLTPFVRQDKSCTFKQCSNGGRLPSKVKLGMFLHILTISWLNYKAKYQVLFPINDNSLKMLHHLNESWFISVREKYRSFLSFVWWGHLGSQPVSGTAK